MFVACGINHKTAPLLVREKIAMPLASQQMLLRSLMDFAEEGAILSTCNRTEIYCDTEQPELLPAWLAKQQDFEEDVLSPYLYMYQGHEGIRHTLRVASGLDSMMLGEPQILGQMKQAYQFACDVGTVSSTLRQVFPYIFSASKRIRNRSGIGTNPVSLAYVGVQLIGSFFPNFKDLQVLLIGSGETSALVAKYLQKQGVKRFLIASRTPKNAQRLAETLKGEALSIAEIPQNLAQADVVISATACPLPFISKALVEHALTIREQAPMFFLDLAVPRDIEANVAELDHVHLYNIDDLQSMISKGMDERRSAALQAEQLVDCELDNYIRWHRSLQAKDVICDYRSHMQHLAEQELKRAQEKLSAGFEHDSVLREFCTRLVNKLTHHPSVGLRQAALDGREELLDLANYLFNAPLTQALYEEIS